MRSCAFMLTGACLFLCLNVLAAAQNPADRAFHAPQPTAEDDDPRLILEVGAASNWTTSGGSTTFAPSLAAETTPIETCL